MSKRSVLGTWAWLAAAVLMLTSCAARAAAPSFPTTSTRSPASAAPTAVRAANLTVFAAASLTDAFKEIGRRFEIAHPGTQVAFNFAGSQQLVLQIEQGAVADVFASADQRNMTRLVADTLVASDAPVVFARNRLVVILPGDNPGHVETPKDLAKPGLKLVLAGEAVPVGNYSRQVLDKLSADPAYGSGFKEAVLKNVVSNEDNVKQVVVKVQLGEADAGIVYRSDVTPAVTGKLKQVEIPDSFDVIAAYPIAVLKAAPQVDLARQFVRFVLTPDSQAILGKWGLTPAAK